MAPTLSPNEQQALRALVAFLHECAGERLERVALFGSKARGSDGPDSDIDVLVILTREDRQLRREIIRQAARLSLKYDVLLSPRVMGTDRWAEMQGFSFYQNVQRDATDLAP